MRRIGPTERKIRFSAYHGTLIAGSLVFAFPFIWLFSTSAKVQDEMYPPRWIPGIPKRAVTSPYIGIRQNERPVRPVMVARTDWNRLERPVLDAITDKAAGMSDVLPAFYRPHLEERELAEGIMNRLVRRAPDELFERAEEPVCTWFYERTDEELVRSVFETVYRRMAMAEVAFHGKDIVTIETPTKDETDPANFDRSPWEVVAGDAELVPRTAGLLRPAQEVHYSYQDTDAFTLTITLPLEMPADNLKKIVVSVHGDRSWHAMNATVELDGKRFEAAQSAFLSSDRWQDVTWQFAGPDDESIATKSWIRLDEAGTSEFVAPGKVRIMLECPYSGRFGASLDKYANNYREVVRKIPLWLYVKNSVILVVLNIAGQIIGSSLVAYSFARLRWPARDFCFVLVLATLMIPAQVTMIPVFLIFKNLGWYNTLRPLWVGSFFGSAFYIFLLRQFMRGIPTDLEDSAKIDGCSYLGIYARIILPLVKPALAAIGIFTFQGVWNEFMQPLIYLSDQELYPLSLGLFAFKVSFTNGILDYGLMMAAAVIMTMPVIVVFFAAQRHFIQGITLTGLKG